MNLRALRANLKNQILNCLIKWIVHKMLKVEVNQYKDFGIAITSSKILGTRDWNHADYLNKMRIGTSLMEVGHYFEGLDQLKVLHENLYELFSNQHREFYPSYLSREWTNAFGHIPNIGSLIRMHQLGLVERIPERAIVSSAFQDNPLIEVFGKDISFQSDVENSLYWSQLPSFLWLFMSQNLIWSKGKGFLSFDELLNSLYNSDISDSSVAERRNMLKFDLPDHYLRNSRNTLKELGFETEPSEDKWFVALHLRGSHDYSRKIRNVSLDSYIPVIDEIGRRGGKVIRICTDNNSPLPKRDFLLDCARFPNTLRDIHLYALAKARLFIGTSSGPYAYPRIFGTNSIVTNTVAIGRGTFPSSALQEYLPMRMFRAGKEMTLMEILSDPVGWADTSFKKLRERQIEPKQNSSEEIRNAIGSALDRIQGIASESPDLHERVREVRATFRWTSSGSFSETFLSHNQHWLM